MWTETMNEKRAVGLERLTGSKRGRYYTNEREGTRIGEDGQEEKVWTYDVYEVDDVSRFKNDVMTDAHPWGDETKILRKTIAKMLKASGDYDKEQYGEFRAYNEFAEHVD